MSKNGRIAFFLFAGIPVLSILFLYGIAHTHTGWWGLPSWLLGFVLIELFYCGVVWWFVTKVWK